MKKNPLTEKIRQLNSSLYDSEGQTPNLQQTVSAISSIIDAAVFIVNREGDLLTAESGSLKLDDNLSLLLKDQSLKTDKGIMQLLKSIEAVYNQTDPTKKNNGDYYYSLVPLAAEEKKSALMMICSAKKPLDSDQLVMVEIGVLLMVLLSVSRNWEKKRK